MRSASFIWLDEGVDHLVAAKFLERVMQSPHLRGSIARSLGINSSSSKRILGAAKAGKYSADADRSYYTRVAGLFARGLSDERIADKLGEDLKTIEAFRAYWLRDHGGKASLSELPTDTEAKRRYMLVAERYRRWDLEYTRETRERAKRNEARHSNKGPRTNGYDPVGTLRGDVQ